VFVLRDIVLILSVLIFFVLGFFIIIRLDKFVNENRKSIEKENEKKEPSCIMLTEELSDEEITEIIRRFRNGHEESRIMIYDGTDTGLTRSIEDYIERK